MAPGMILRDGTSPGSAPPQDERKPLYTIEILRLAASIPEFARLPEPRGVGEKRSQTCGSSIHTEVQLDDDGRIVTIAQQVRACAFGQASAALVARSAEGRSRQAIAEARESFAAWLRGDSDQPGAWPGLGDLAPARPKTARHPAMLLPFDALIAAIDDVHPRLRR